MPDMIINGTGDYAGHLGSDENQYFRTHLDAGQTASFDLVDLGGFVAGEALWRDDGGNELGLVGPGGQFIHTAPGPEAIYIELHDTQSGDGLASGKDRVDVHLADRVLMQAWGGFYNACAVKTYSPAAEGTKIKTAHPVGCAV